ncbi:hypothetical protein SESBI_11137 [Sesbania bispinosa]|nr:hypothetical protein SESBI_11137 [Sesbania bispinosa]
MRSKPGQMKELLRHSPESCHALLLVTTRKKVQLESMHDQEASATRMMDWCDVEMNHVALKQLAVGGRYSCVWLCGHKE